MPESATDSTPVPDYDAIIIGAGISGLYQLYRLRELGMHIRVFEAGTGVGGTWYWNRYPGARFDSESWSYGYSWSRELLDEWEWGEARARIEPGETLLVFSDGVTETENTEHLQYDESSNGEEPMFNRFLREAGDLSPEELADFMRRAHEPEVLGAVRPVSGAIEVLRQWIEAGFEIEVVTGRPPSTAAVSPETSSMRSVQTPSPQGSQSSCSS